MRKKIFIMAHSMEIGGAEQSLLGLLENIDIEQYTVDLFLLRHEGELLKYLPPYINLLPANSNYAAMGIPITDALKRKQFSVVAGRIIGKFKAKRKIKKNKITCDNNIQNEYSHKYTVNLLPTINDIEYDAAISFMSPHYYVAQKVLAKKKIAWIHTDYTTFEVDKQSELKMWDAYDYIASISENVTKNFLLTFPSLERKIVLIPNILPIKKIELQSKERIESTEMPSDGSIKLLSIGRFCTPKNFDNIPSICKILREQGYNVRWYIIGYGPDENLIKEKIKSEQMEEFVVLLGKKDNPYPYIKCCDLYVQPSRYEGKCVAVLEAQTLHKPVIITNYSTAPSQLVDGYDGIIVPLDNKDCALAIGSLLTDTNRISQLINNTYRQKYDNSSSIEKLYEIVQA